MIDLLVPRDRKSTYTDWKKKTKSTTQHKLDSGQYALDLKSSGPQMMVLETALHPYLVCCPLCADFILGLQVVLGWVQKHYLQVLPGDTTSPKGDCLSVSFSKSPEFHAKVVSVGNVYATPWTHFCGQLIRVTDGPGLITCSRGEVTPNQYRVNTEECGYLCEEKRW